MADTLQETLRQLDRTRHQRSSLTVGKVVANDDPLKLGRVQLEFTHDWQSSPTAEWALPIYPIAGDIGFDPPAEKEWLVCLFLDGNPMQPYYLGRTIGTPRKEEVSNLAYEGGDALHLAIAESVADMLGDLLKWMGRHTHDVIVSANGTSLPTGGPVTPIPTKNTTLASTEPLPKVKPMAAKKIRIHKRNDPAQDDVPKTRVEEPNPHVF
jgi:hypothetical protein